MKTTQIASDVRTLIAVRVVVVTSLLLAALLIQFTVSETILPIDYLYLTTAFTYALTFVYIGVARVTSNRAVNLYIQSIGDLLVETSLVYFTGGLDSPFSFLYLVSIITASMLLYRRGGLFVASGAVILYGALADLMYYRILPAPPASLFSETPWTPVRLYVNMGMNFAGFYATALLTSYISERLRETSAELTVNRENLARLKAINENVVESIPSGLMTLDPSGIVTFLNPAGSTIIGVDPADAVGRHITEIAVFTDSEWRSLTAQVEATRVAHGEKGDYVRGDELAILGYALTPLKDLSGTWSGLTLIFQDLTEMKRLEFQLRLKDRMAAVGELSAGIAHEIRNPLAAIAGSVQVLKRSTSLSDQEKRLMSIILKESERLNKTIADFLRFVKPHEKLPVRFDVAASLAETLDLLGNSPEVPAGGRIERSIEPPSFTIVGDPDQIRQVFWNLARNAFQAMPGGGVLHVSAAPCDAEYVILFSDEGRGMSDSEQRTLFQPFRTKFPTGTGLGMAISYRIVQEHSGRIAVQSVENEGTTIAVHLPVDGIAVRDESMQRTTHVKATSTL